MSSDSFIVKELYHNTYSILDKGLGQGSVYMYLLVGSTRALLVDSGYGLLDLKDVVRSITDREVVCVCTHGHVDHAPGSRHFEESYLHSNDFEVFRQHTDAQFLQDMAMKGLTFKPSRRALASSSYQQMVKRLVETRYPLPRALDDVESFDLGGRTVSWRLVPGHTGGSIAMIDEMYHTVFDGDSAPVGVWLFLPESSGLSDYLVSLREYQAFLCERQIKQRYAGHSGAPFTQKHLAKLIRCIETADARPNRGMKMKTMVGDARIVFAGGSIAFCRR